MSSLRRHPAPAGNAASCTPLLLVLLALVVPVVTLAPAAPACGQEAPAAETNDDWQPLERFDEAISVEVTNIEVWVTDRRGDPVTGLDADDFVLTEDGEPVAVTNFASYTAEGSGSWAEPARVAEAGETGAPAEAEAPGSADPALAADPAASASVAGDRSAELDADPESRLHLAILIDNWNLRPADRARVFQDLREFLRERMSPGDRAMVIAHDRSLALVQEPTGDTDELLAALARVERSAMTNVQLQNARRTAYQNIRDAYENAIVTPADDTVDPCVLAWGDMQNQAREYATTILSHTQRSGGALASAGGLLAGVPGRKILLYVGSGLPQQAGSEVFQYLTEICPHNQQEIATWYSQFDLSWLYEEVARQANANGLTLYAIEASAPQAADDMSIGGLAAPTTPREGGGSGGGIAGNARVSSAGQTFRPSAAARRSAELDSEAGLFYVANETGGRAILNAADFSRDFERLASELRTYYSLGFTPGHGGDGRLHRIEVKLAPGVGGPEGGGYRVRHRQSYRDKPYEVRMAEKIRGVAQFGTESNRMHIRVETGEATATAGGYRVPIRVWVPLDEMTLVEPPGGAAEVSHRAGRLRVMMAVSDAAGNLGPVRQKLVTVEVGRADAGSAPAGRREHLVEVDLDLPTADHVVALGLRDELGGETSFVRHEIRLSDDPPISATGEESRR